MKTFTLGGARFLFSMPLKLKKMFRKLNILFLILMSIMMSCSPPRGKISPDSKVEECKQNLIDALYAFSTSSGLPINISPEDGTTIFDNGEISKSYGRDGYQYTVYFGLESGDEGCKLVFYRKDKKGPGESSSTQGGYGSVILTECKCQQ